MNNKRKIFAVNLFFALFFALLLLFVLSFPLSPFLSQLRFGADISELAESRNFDELSENVGFDSVMIRRPGSYEEAELSEDETAELLNILSKYVYKYTPFAGTFRGDTYNLSRDTVFDFYRENYEEFPAVARKNGIYTKGVRVVAVLPSSVSVAQCGTKGPEAGPDFRIIYSCREPALLEEINEFIEKTK